MKDEIKILQDYATLLEKSAKDYDYYFDKVNELDKATQDILHQLELGNSDVAIKWARKLIQIRKQRRCAKDLVQKLEPLKVYYESNVKEVNKIKMLVGDIRKNDKYFENKRYSPRVIKDLDISKGS